MPTDPFFHTNVLVYAFVQDPRHEAAKSVVADGGVISVQVGQRVRRCGSPQAPLGMDDVVTMLAEVRAFWARRYR